MTVDPSKLDVNTTIPTLIRSLVAALRDGVTTFTTGTLTVKSLTRTRSVLTSGSGTYTTPAKCLYITVRLVGGGGGGGGGGTSGTAGVSNGVDTTFGTSLLVGHGGALAPIPFSGGGAGGTASLGSGPTGVALTGAAGQGGNVVVLGSADNSMGGFGAGTPFSGPTPSGVYVSGGANAAANTGAGGGGGSGGNAANLLYGGGGGGAGGYVDAWIATPAATYAYVVGAGGTGGASGGGVNAATGGNGGSGLIIVDEFYL